MYKIQRGTDGNYRAFVAETFTKTDYDWKRVPKTTKNPSQRACLKELIRVMGWKDATANHRSGLVERFEVGS